MSEIRQRFQQLVEDGLFDRIVSVAENRVGLSVARVESDRSVTIALLTDGGYVFLTLAQAQQLRVDLGKVLRET